MNEREIFETVKKHLLAQDERARDEIGHCAYKGQNGQCAVGCLIDDKYYHICIEGKPIEHIFLIEAINKSLGLSLTPDSPTVKLLRALQNVHDDIVPYYWGRELDNLEKKYFN